MVVASLQVWGSCVLLSFYEHWCENRPYLGAVNLIFIHEQLPAF